MFTFFEKRFITRFILYKLLEPYAMKVARTVLRGGKTERSYLSQQKVAGSNPATLTFLFQKKELQFEKLLPMLLKSLSLFFYKQGTREGTSSILFFGTKNMRLFFSLSYAPFPLIVPWKAHA